MVITIIGLSFIWLHDYAENAYQADGDSKRIYDINQIASMVEEYKIKTGKYPLETQLSNGKVLHVMIVRSLEEFGLKPPAPQHSDYKHEFLTELRAVLGNDITLPYDPQLKPYKFYPMYQYSIRSDGVYFISTNLYNASPYGYSRKLGEHRYKYQLTSANNQNSVASGSLIYKDISLDIITNIKEQGIAANNKFKHIFVSTHEPKGIPFQLQ